MERSAEFKCFSVKIKASTVRVRTDVATALKLHP